MREVVERYFEIMNRLEIDALADDVVFRLPFAPEPVPQLTAENTNKRVIDFLKA